MWLYLYVLIVNNFGFLNPIITVVYKSTAMYSSWWRQVTALACHSNEMHLEYKCCLIKLVLLKMIKCDLLYWMYLTWIDCSPLSNTLRDEVLLQVDYKLVEETNENNVKVQISLLVTIFPIIVLSCLVL